jgi:hypothetical protein
VLFEIKKPMRLPDLSEQIVLLFHAAVARQVLSQPLAIVFCFDLVRLIANGVTQFVAYCEIQELVKRNTPFCERLDLSPGLKHDQAFIQESLAIFEMAEGRA